MRFVVYVFDLFDVSFTNEPNRKYINEMIIIEPIKNIIKDE